jgi:hypothetical protein
MLRYESWQAGRGITTGLASHGTLQAAGRVSSVLCNSLDGMYVLFNILGAVKIESDVTKNGTRHVL